jgi:hypothetical protein
MPEHLDRSRRLARLAAAALTAAALSAPVLAEGPTPDPPIPPELVRQPLMLASAQPTRVHRVAIATPAGADAVELLEPDCRCSALYVRDLGRRVEGHVELWESLPRERTPVAPAPLTSGMNASYMQLATFFVDGVVGFPLHDNRLSD